jgi:integrase
MTLADVQRLEAAELKGRAADARDLFVLSFYAGGMRVSDALMLKWSQVDRTGEPWRVRWRQKKTGDPVALPVVVGGRVVLERWLDRTGPGGTAASPFVFGLLEEDDLRDPRRLRARVGARSALVRKKLYGVFEGMGLPRLGPHAARHSLADHLRKGGVSVYDISRVLGHSSIQVTERYLKSLDEERAGAALVGAFGSDT